MTGPYPLGLEPATLRTVGGHPVWVVPLGYTKPPLSLNDRGGYHVRARKVRELRTRVAWKLRALDTRQVPHITVALHYVPVDRRARDSDNLVATLKPCIDAMTGRGKGAAHPLVADDTPRYVTWPAPIIHEPDEHGPRLWLVITAGAGQ